MVFFGGVVVLLWWLLVVEPLVFRFVFGVNQRQSCRPAPTLWALVPALTLLLLVVRCRGDLILTFDESAFDAPQLTVSSMRKSQFLPEYSFRPPMQMPIVYSDLQFGEFLLHYFPPFAPTAPLGAVMFPFSIIVSKFRLSDFLIWFPALPSSFSSCWGATNENK